MWGLSSQTRDWACVPCNDSIVLTTGPPGKSLKHIFKNTQQNENNNFWLQDGRMTPWPLFLQNSRLEKLLC